MALCQAKSHEEGYDGDGLPYQPVAGLHVPKHEGLDLCIIKDVCLALGVVAFD